MNLFVSSPALCAHSGCVPSAPCDVAVASGELLLGRQHRTPALPSRAVSLLVPCASVISAGLSVGEYTLQYCDLPTLICCQLPCPCAHSVAASQVSYLQYLMVKSVSFSSGISKEVSLQLNTFGESSCFSYSA